MVSHPGREPETGRVDAAELRSWLRAGSWERLDHHFRRVPPRSAAEYEARALTTMALRAGPAGARQALPDLRQVCRLDPTNVLAAANLIQALIDGGDPTEALRLTHDAMRQAPHVVPLAEKHALALVAAGQWDAASVAVAHAISAGRAAGAPASELMAALRGELDSGWWRPLSMGDVELTLPAESDRAFVAECFADRAFVSRYRRSQGHDERAVEAFVALGRQRPRLAGRIDWIVRSAASRLGLASVSDIDFANGRGELLVGLRQPDAVHAAGLKASLAVMEFAFGALGLRKLVSFVYGDNPTAQANTLHLGLRQEGLLRQHLVTADGPLDLYVNGLLAAEYRADARLRRMRQRWRGG